MAGDGRTRAFAGAPQPVEIHHLGIWYSGELLGWRHEADGRVVARVRCVIDRLRHSAWKDFAELRLPDPASPPRRELPGSAPSTPTVPGDDSTRPHALLADLRSRPGAPEHVRTPPPRPSEEPGRPRWEPVERSTNTAVRPGAGEYERRKAYLSAV